MKSYENTFIRGPSPTYSSDMTSENAMSATLPIGERAANDLSHINDAKNANKDYIDEKFNSINDEEAFSTSTYPEEKKGRNTFAFWAIVIVMLVLTVGNLLLTLIMLGVLHMGKGIRGMELIPEEDIIKFYGSTDLDRIYPKNTGQIDGFADVPVSITGDDGEVSVRVYRNGALNDRIVLDKEGIIILATNIFEVRDPSTKNAIFTTHRPQYNIPKGAPILAAKSVSASRISSPIGEKLTVESDSRISIKGSEGISLDSGACLLQAENHISLNSTQGFTILEAGAGIFLDMDRIPIVSSEFGLRTGSVQYKICVCMPRGNLFRIAIPRIHNGPKISCAHFNSKEDPCALN